jgi:hypothetical protein
MAQGTEQERAADLMTNREQGQLAPDQPVSMATDGRSLLMRRINPLGNLASQGRSQRGDREAIQNFPGKPIQQERSRRGQIQAATATVKQLRFFQLADRGTVGALHIIRNDFQLWLGVHPRLGRQQQIAVELGGVGLLCIMIHKNPSIEDRVAPIVRDALVQLIGGSVGMAQHQGAMGVR